jgi:hypothetical protein
MKSLLELLLKRIVKYPEEVTVVEYEEQGNIVYEIVVNSEDVGQIIGKDGRTIKSLNTILNASKGEKEGKFVLKVIR